MVGFFGQFFLGFLFSSISCLAQSSLSLSFTTMGKMETFVSPVRFEGIVFEKRSRNASPINTSISYELSSQNSIGTVSMSWLRNGKKVEEKPNEFYTSKQLNNQKTKMTIILHLRDAAIIPGNYTLTVNVGTVSETAFGAVVSAPILPIFHKPKRVLEGDMFRIFCSVTGYPPPTEVLWWFAPIPVGQMDDDEALSSALHHLQPVDFNTTRYSKATSSDEAVPNDTLVFSQLLVSDNGLYACNTSNAEGSDISLLLINVKDRWAAVWPFTGIVIEVTVLVAAILLYERHQMRSKPTSNAAATAAAAGKPVSAPAAAENHTASAVGAGEYPPQATGVSATAENRLRTMVQPPDPVPAQVGIDAVDSVVGAARAANTDLEAQESKPDEVRLRGAATKC